jgi:inhibitor of KinA sporulation pathway (predicted exonuclease)
MNVMVLDAEYNQPSRKTIQIGAAVFNPRNAACLERLTLYVNPGEPITPEITKLTGVRDQDVANGMSIIEAYDELKRFHARHKCFKNPLVWGSGFRNDSQHIYHEYLQAKGLSIDDSFLQEENFMGFRVLDVKTIYQSVQIFENSKHGGGLKESMARFGLEFEGSSHDALNDALNTFRFWYHLMRIFHDGTKNK